MDNPNVLNVGKAGRTFPVKFQLQDSLGNWVSSLNAVKAISVIGSNACGSGSSDPIDYSTADTAGLHYDSTANQFVYNWKTPSTGGCLVLKLTLTDNTTPQALFNLS